MIHTAIDDLSRLAYSEILADEQGATAAAGSHPNPPAAAAPPDVTASAAAVTAPPTARSASSQIVRMRRHQPTRDYVQCRTAEGLSKREMIRCLKRYIVREICAHLARPAGTTSSEAPLAAHPTTPACFRKSFPSSEVARFASG